MSPRSSFFLDKFGDIQEEERILGGEEKTKLRGRGGVEAMISLKNRSNMSLYIDRLLTTYHLLYLFIFIIL